MNSRKFTVPSSLHPMGLHGGVPGGEREQSKHGPLKPHPQPPFGALPMTTKQRSRKADHELLLKMFDAAFRANDTRAAFVEWKFQAAEYLPELLTADRDVPHPQPPSPEHPMSAPETGHFRRTKAGALVWVEPHQVHAHIAEHGPEPDAPVDDRHGAWMARQALEEAFKGHDVIHAIHVPGVGWMDIVKSRSTP